MTAATMQQTPAIPPRPVRNQDKDDLATSVPKVPPRPAGKRLVDRSISPNPDRFAPSPLNDGIPIKSPRALHFSTDDTSQEHLDEPIDNSTLPSVGEEGREYNAVTEEIEVENQERASSPEQTRTIAEDLKLHAPKPSLPAQSAKQRVQTVTRTDSEKAASYGIGRPTSRNAVKKKPSTTFSNSESQPDVDDDQGIPEIGQRVPMNPHLGDVQAPSPAPGSEEFKRHHTRKHSSRGGPPGSYGMHGHGVAPQDKLDKAYYEKNPHVFDREHKTPIHDRQNDFAMSSNDLNKLVRDTASHGSGLATSSEYHATPTDEVGFQASEEYSRISSPNPISASGSQPRAPSFKSEVTGPNGERTVHVDDPKHPQYRSPGDIEKAVDDDEHEYTAPILAPDEVSKDKSQYIQQPAVHPPAERRRSSNEFEESHSRPTSRPTSLYKENSSQDFGSTPLDDVKEYEPLFPEESKEAAQNAAASEAKARHYFPSKDIWEDAPNSAHYTAEVSTPDLTEKSRSLSAGVQDRPKTPAAAFAQKQEELAEREVNGPADVKPTQSQEQPTWSEPQSSSASFLTEKRPAISQRFPSRDVWEDVPESHLYETTVSVSSGEEDKPEEESKPEIPVRPTKKSADISEKPAIPERPKPKQSPPVDEAQKSRPPVSDKPKPQIPPRPAKSSSGDSKDGDFSKPKPPVPSRPVGGKIAALQAGFMSDLNKRLQLGPQAPKKEEPEPQEDLIEEKEKAPLADARKSRARGPQRRAPAKSPAAPEPAKTSGPALSFSLPQTFWSVDPDQGKLAVAGEETPAPAVEETSVPVIDKANIPVVEEAHVPAVEEASVPVAEDTPVPVVEEKQEVEKTEVVPGPSAPEEPTTDAKEETEEDSKPTVEENTEVPITEEKTLVSNTAGDSILEASVEKKDDGNVVQPVEVSDEVKN
ncbi:altered inheritance of mitochondria protein 21 [Dactylonectria estremocensis]|uniref:Altered inheritance of mitochondria protein 21 n=1 Tax=Dactylonectria estremocensis TaxID=1079267 RepID=A0A9P9F2X9_9HYPO|nr:altered inheritance of mitochondria protein 21 [Dactylonectria estremocensis]